MLDSAVFYADLDQLSKDVAALHALSALTHTDDERAHFQHLEHTVNWRLDTLAYVLAASDSSDHPTKKRKW